MIKEFYITGDTHGRVIERLDALSSICKKKEETALIVLGDFGVNFFLNKTDQKNKKVINNCGFHIYAVRGNHEERPSNLGYEKIYDEDVNGYIYIEKEYPNIRYFLDEGGEYTIQEKSVLVVPGAYSVDKDYRIARFGKDGWNGWFQDEQLKPQEMDYLLSLSTGKHYDLILSHTCPASYMPMELFLSCIDQSKVDKTMEDWMDKLKENCTWDMWLFGHYHEDMLIKKNVKMYYFMIENLDEVYSNSIGFKRAWGYDDNGYSWKYSR